MDFKCPNCNNIIAHMSRKNFYRLTHNSDRTICESYTFCQKCKNKIYLIMSLDHIKEIHYEDN